MPIAVVRIDPCISAELDLTKDTCRDKLFDVSSAGRVAGAICSPPCSTWSRARRQPLTDGVGPRPPTEERIANGGKRIAQASKGEQRRAKEWKGEQRRAQVSKGEHKRAKQSEGQERRAKDSK